VCVPRRSLRRRRCEQPSRGSRELATRQQVRRY
jgi:hypothetical protein